MRAADVEMTVSGESNDVLILKETFITHLTYSDIRHISDD